MRIEPELQGHDGHVIQVLPVPDVARLEQGCIGPFAPHAGELLAGDAGKLIEARFGQARPEAPHAVHEELGEVPRCRRRPRADPRPSRRGR